MHYFLIMSLLQVHTTYPETGAGGTAQQHIEQWPPSSSSAVLEYSVCDTQRLWISLL